MGGKKADRSATWSKGPLKGDPVDSKGLTEKRRVFIREVMVDWNLKRAAQVAGYKRPADAGYKLMNQPAVAKEIQRRQRALEKEAILSRERVMAELSSLAMRDVIEMCDEEGMFIVNDMRQVPDYLRRCIDGVEVFQDFDKDGNLAGQRVKFKLVGKLGAFDMLNKMAGYYAPEEHNVHHGVNWDELYDQQEQSGDVIEGEIVKMIENGDV